MAAQTTHKTYITRMPDKAGAFLIASRAIAECGGNIVGVNYNKAVDTHTLFIEVDATEPQHDRINARLNEVEYLADDPSFKQIVLIEMKLPDEPGTLLPVLEVVNRHEVNIPYINSRENGTPYQYFKLGLLMEDSTVIKHLIDEISQLCEVRVLDYETSDHLLDSTVFYVTFANKMRDTLELSQGETNEVLSISSSITQMLDAQGESPKQVFESIRRVARFVADHQGDNFDAKVTSRMVAPGLMLYAIEPPCGTNTYVFEHDGALLFVDTGLACFEAEMVALLDRFFGSFAARRKSVLLTHAGIDSAGLADVFDTVYVGRNNYMNIDAQHRGKPGHKAKNPLRGAYYNLGKALTRYVPPRLGRCVMIGKRIDDGILGPVGSLRFGDWTFDVLEGAGGNARGECVIVCDDLRLVFTGGLYTNDAGLSDEQRELEALRPNPVANIDRDPALAAQIRAKILADYRGYTICPGLGPIIG